jgi:hypothetical protein
MSDEVTRLPTPDGEDVAVALGRAVVGSIPAVGAAATELFNWFVKPPIERRRDEWMRQVGETLDQLKTRGIDLEELQNDEKFVDVVMQATHVAMRNHQEEKREAFRNAIANSVGPDAPEESKRQIFLQLIDRFTVWHLTLLKVFADPNGWFDSHNQPRQRLRAGQVSEAIESAFPQLREQKEFYELIYDDLGATGLVEATPMPGIVTLAGNYAKISRPLGDEFLNYISAPRTVG